MTMLFQTLHLYFNAFFNKMQVLAELLKILMKIQLAQMIIGIILMSVLSLIWAFSKHLSSLIQDSVEVSDGWLDFIIELVKIFFSNSEIDDKYKDFKKIRKGILYKKEVRIAKVIHLFLTIISKLSPVIWTLTTLMNNFFLEKNDAISFTLFIIFIVASAYLWLLYNSYYKKCFGKSEKVTVKIKRKNVKNY